MIAPFTVELTYKLRCHRCRTVYTWESTVDPFCAPHMIDLPPGWTMIVEQGSFFSPLCPKHILQIKTGDKVESIR